MVSKVRSNLAFSEMNLTEAISNKGENVLFPLRNIDAHYSEIIKSGDYIDLKFSTNGFLENNSVYVLQGTGYYHHEREYSHSPYWKELRTLRKPMTMHQVSQDLERMQSILKLVSK